MVYTKNSKLTLSIILIVIVLFTFACGSSFEKEAPASNESEQVIAAVNRIVDASNNEDVDAYMSAVHPKSIFSRQDHIDMLITNFAQFNIHETMTDIVIDSLDRDEARVSFTMLVDFNSSDFQNREITGTYTMRKDNGTWKLFAYEVKESVEKQIQPRQ
jgi:hypothetical protein